jgi:hypothetical protein
MYKGELEMKEFMEKTFKDGDKVWIRRLGPSYEGMEFRGVVKGVLGTHPYESYIVEMIDRDLLTIEWTCFVFPKGCLDVREDLFGDNVWMKMRG